MFCFFFSTTQFCLYKHLIHSVNLPYFYFPICGLCSNSIFVLQFSSVAQLCLTLCDPRDCSTLGLPVHHQLPELTQTH